MRSTKSKKAVAVATAIGMMAVSPMTALADTMERVVVEGTEGNGIYDAVSNDKAVNGGVAMTDSGTTPLNGNVTIKGDVSVTDKKASTTGSYVTGAYISSDKGSAELNIGGSINVDNTKGGTYADGILIQKGGNSNITVGGDVSVKANSAHAYGVSSYSSDSNTIKIGGNVAAKSDNGYATGMDITTETKVTVDKSVEVSAGQTSTATGVKVSTAKGEVNIGKNVTASGADTKGIYVYQSGEKGKISVNVGGDVKSTGTTDGKGIYIGNNYGTVDIKVGGDVNGSTAGIFIENNSKNAAASVTVGGTLSASADDAHAIVISNYGSSVAEPEITAWKIESTDSIVAVTGGSDEKTRKEAAEKIQSNINYIIKADTTENGETSSNGKIVLKAVKGELGSVKIGDKTYETANKDQTIIINVETARGYKSTVKNNGTGTLTANANGTYTLTIPEGGGVDLRAVLEKIESDRRSSDGGRSSDREEKTNNVITLSADNLTDTAYPEQGNDQGWTSNGLGWRVKKPDGNYANNEWYYSSWNGEENWYHFDERGYLQSGWLTDADGQKYYLYNAHDGQYGRMLTGWNEINGRWYFFNTAATGTAPLGALFTNGITPDGYTVDASGARVQ